MLIHRPIFVVACCGWLATTWAMALPADPPARTEMVSMSDGVKLATDIYLPEGPGPFPTALMRTPYDKSQERTAAEAAEGVKRGYAVVLQDTRGRFASEGRNVPFSGEMFHGHRDASDTLAWIRRQSWCAGDIAMFGGSATGMTQLWAAAQQPAGLACLHVGVAPASFYRDMVYPGGILHKHLMESWFTLTKFEPGALELWKQRPAEDDYWRARDLTAHFEKIDVPAVHVGGYYDIFVNGTVSTFNAIQERGGPAARGRQKLLLGPWTHITGIEHSGILQFPGAARPPNGIDDKWAWFDHHVRGISNGIDRTAAVTYYVMGDVTDPRAPGKRWKTAKRWPPEGLRTVSYFPGADRSLSGDRPKQEARLAYVYDPADPAPTAGGLQFFGGITVGTQDQRPLEQRSDVLTFTTAVIKRPLEIAGQPRVKLRISSDAPDTDFFVKLCDVYPDGRSINLSEGQLRARFRQSMSEPIFMKADETCELDIPLSHTAAILNTGHRLRLLVTSSSHPGHEVNPNTGDAPGAPRPARNTIHTGGAKASMVTLPIMSGH